MNRLVFTVFSLVFGVCVSATAAQAQSLDGRLKTIAAKKTIKIAYRQDATPFAFMNERTKPVSYTHLTLPTIYSV